MSLKIFFITLVLLSPSPTAWPWLDGVDPEYFIVWNIGQGQWTTYVQSNSCLHFDMGGEYFPTAKIKKICSHKTNYIYLSHWDWDHIGGLRLHKKLFTQACVARAPLGTSTAKKTQLVFNQCTQPPALDWEWAPTFNKKLSSNDLSRVYIFKHILIPGDSTVLAEKTWAKQVKNQHVHLLILGHHGSKTSTSEYLLTQLRGVQMAVSTARWSRYHHPHPETVQHLKKYKIPLLRTEDWGNLWFAQ